MPLLALERGWERSERKRGSGGMHCPTASSGERKGYERSERGGR
jgi:hypothetical protein